MVISSSSILLAIMRSLALNSLLLGLASAAVVKREANYDGYQVVRLQVGGNLTQVQNVIETLSLSTWNGGPKTDSEVDIVVPADVTEQFEADTAGLSTSVMHPNLGESIAREAAYPVYEGAFCFPFLIKCNRSDSSLPLKPAVLIRLGLTTTILTRITSNFSTTSNLNTPPTRRL